MKVAHSATDSTRVGSRAPLHHWAVKQISEAKEHLFHLSSCLVGVCPPGLSEPSSGGLGWQQRAPLPRTTTSSRLAHALEQAGFLVGFTCGGRFCRHILYLASFCLCSIKSLEQDKFIVYFPLVWHLAANESQIPQPMCRSHLAVCGVFHPGAACEISLRERESSSARAVPPAWCEDSCETSCARRGCASTLHVFSSLELGWFGISGCAFCTSDPQCQPALHMSGWLIFCSSIFCTWKSWPVRCFPAPN